MQRYSATLGKDPFGYDGPLRDAEGNPPFNGYWWPLSAEDDYWDRERGYDCRWNHLAAVPLNNGKWLNSFHGCFTWGRQFDSRDVALRAGVAGIIRRVRNTFRSQLKPDRARWGFDRTTIEQRDHVIAWALGIVDRPPRPLSLAARRRFLRQKAITAAKVEAIRAAERAAERADRKAKRDAKAVARMEKAA